MKSKKTNKLLLGFELEVISLQLTKILPSHLIKRAAKKSRKYHTIIKSIETSGVIEPLVVYPQDDNYILLDGHWRYSALRELDHQFVDCLVSLSDEGFTYNHHVNHLSVIQEQRMMLEAIKKGVPKKLIAEALDVDIAKITEKKKLLDGINSEVIDLLKDKRISKSSLKELKKVVAARQMEMAELMVGMNNYTVSYARSMVAATTDDQLVKKNKKPRNHAMVKMEMEIRHLEKEFQQAEENYGVNMCNLTLFVSYIRRLLDNSKVVTYLSKEHHDIFLEFEQLTQQESI